MKYPILTTESEKDANAMAKVLRAKFVGITVVVSGAAIYIIGKVDPELMFKVYQFAQKIFVLFYGK